MRAGKLHTTASEGVHVPLHRNASAMSGGRQLGALKGVFATLAVTLALYVLFATTMGRIQVNGGEGFDGATYSFMTQRFDPRHWGQLPPVTDVLNRRVLPPAMAHYLDANPIAAFIKLDALAIFAGALAFYGILRFYAIPTGWSLLALAMWLVTYPGLRFWIFYPVLTDASGNALLLGTIWAVLTRRYWIYMILAAALMATRENGTVIFAFFIIFQFNPWNKGRDKTALSPGTLSKFVACNIPAVFVVLFIHYFPPFPAAGHYDQIGSIPLYARQLVGSPERQARTIMAYLNVFGLIPYTLWWGLVAFGATRIFAVLRANLHWLFYVLLHLILAPLAQPDDPERTLLLAVPPLALAAVQCLRTLPLPRLAAPAALLFLTIHAYLVSAFAPLHNLDQYMALGTGSRPWDSVMTHLKKHAVLGVLEVLALTSLAASPAAQRLTGPKRGPLEEVSPPKAAGQS